MPAANYTKWIIPAFKTSDGRYDIIICRNSKNLSQAAADTITLSSQRHFSGDIVINKDRDVNNRLIVTDLATLTFIDGYRYIGVSNSVNVDVDLTSEKKSVFEHIISDRTYLYTLWVRRTKADGTYEYPFCGDFRRKDVKFFDQLIADPSSVDEWSTGTVQIKCSPLSRRIEDLTIEELVKTFTESDTPERGLGDTTHIPEPFYAGLRKQPGAQIGGSGATTGTSYDAENDQGSLTLAIDNTNYARDWFDQFDYSTNLYNQDPTGLPFPASFWGVSIYKALNRVFSHADVSIAFDTSSYDAPNYKLGKQTWNTTSPVKYNAGDFSAAQTLADIYLNFNVVFGIDPRPKGKKTFTVNTATDYITTTENHNYKNGDIIWFFTKGTLPGGLASWTDYYVINKTATTFQVSLTSGGSAVDITSAGTGTLYSYLQLWFESPNTIKREASALEFVKRVCLQFGYFMEFGVTQSGVNEGKPTIYFRQRYQSPPAAFPSLTLAKDGSSEEPPRKPVVIKVSYEGDEDEIYIPRLPQKDEEVIEVLVPWRIKSLANTSGLVFGEHMKLNQKLSSDDQIQCLFERLQATVEISPSVYSVQFTDYRIHDFSHVVGGHLFYYRVKDSTNNTYPAIWDNESQFYGDNNNWEGFHVWNLGRWASDTSSETETLLDIIARIHANDLLRGQYGLKRTFFGVVDGSNSSLGIKPLTSYSTRREAATRNYYADKVTLKLGQQVTEVVFEEQPSSYTTLTDYPIFRKNGSQMTSGGGRASGSNNTGTSTQDVFVATNPKSDTRNVIQPPDADWYGVRIRPFATSPTKDLLRLESDAGTTLYSAFDVTGQLKTYRQAAIQLHPYGTGAGNTGELRFYELAANGSNYVAFKAPDSLAADNTYTLPTAYPGTSGYVLSSTTAGVLSWAAPADLSTAVITNPGTTDRNLIIPTADNTEALSLKRYSGSSAGVYTFSVLNAAGTLRFGINDSLNVVLNDASLLLSSASCPISLNGSQGTSGDILISQGSGNTPAWSSNATVLTNAVIINPGSSTRNTIQPTGDFISLVLKNSGSQTANLLNLVTSAGAVMSYFTKDGYLRLNNPTSPGAVLEMLQPASTNAVKIVCHSSVGSNDGHPLTIVSNGGTSLFSVNDEGHLLLGGSGNPSSSVWLKLVHDTLGDPIANFSSPATNDDPYFQWEQNRAATTDATVTTLHSFTTTSDTTIQVEARVVARRTGGTGGAAGDGAGYIIVGTFKNVSGTVTQIGATTILHSAESQAGWNCTLDINTTAIRVRVTGAANNNVTWHLSKFTVMHVGS